MEVQLAGFHLRADELLAFFAYSPLVTVSRDRSPHSPPHRFYVHADNAKDASVAIAELELYSSTQIPATQITSYTKDQQVNLLVFKPLPKLVDTTSSYPSSETLDQLYRAAWEILRTISVWRSDTGLPGYVQMIASLKSDRKPVQCRLIDNQRIVLGGSVTLMVTTDYITINTPVRYSVLTGEVTASPTMVDGRPNDGWLMRLLPGSAIEIDLPQQKLLLARVLSD